jgi:hypothetical protein
LHLESTHAGENCGAIAWRENRGSVRRVGELKVPIRRPLSLSKTSRSVELPLWANARIHHFAESTALRGL